MMVQNRNRHIKQQAISVLRYKICFVKITHYLKSAAARKFPILTGYKFIFICKQSDIRFLKKYKSKLTKNMKCLKKYFGDYLKKICQVFYYLLLGMYKLIKKKLIKLTIQQKYFFLLLTFLVTHYLNKPRQKLVNSNISQQSLKPFDQK